jgi:hypothetical protein
MNWQTLEKREFGMKREKSTEGQNVNTSAAPRLLSLKAVAAYLGLTIWGMRERIWAGDIPFVRFPGGRKLYVDKKDIDDFIQRNKIRFDF